MHASLQEQIALLPSSQRDELIGKLPKALQVGLLHQWRGYKARPNQLRPGTAGASDDRKDWRYWLLQAGRGAGKTRTGAETIREAEAEGVRLFHLIAPTAADVRNVMIEGPGGLLSCYPPSNRPTYHSTRNLVTWPSGAIALTFSAEEPERLRGPQCEFAWCDEIAAWRYGIDVWDQMNFGLRLGTDPRAVLTSTPKPTDLFKAVVKHPKTVITRGSTYENRSNLAAGFFEDIISKYEGTRLGRQELMAELLEDIPGALWQRWMIDNARVTLDKVPRLIRVVVAIDPAVTAGEDSDETGIGVVGLGVDGRLYVLADDSQRSSPNTWARAACKLFLKWDCDRIIAEVNNGGDLVEMNLRAIHRDIPYRAVRASRGKATRAEPVAALYEQGRVSHVGFFGELEDQLCGYVPGVTEKSPDRLDWLVWAIYDLVIAPAEAGLVTYAPQYSISPY